MPSTEQAGCQWTRTDCYCTKATLCVNNPDTSTNTHSACSCKIPTKIGCCRGMPCVCASKSQDQVYYNKRIDEEIAEWLKEVPVHSIEGSDSKKKRDSVIKELRKTLKQLPDDENYDENTRNEVKSFIEDFPLWNPGKDRKDEKLFKNQFSDKLTERILSVPRKSDRFKDIVKKWVANMDFEDDGEDVDKESIIDKFVNKLKWMAVDRPACDIKYTHILRKEIIELLVELALKFDGDMVMLKKMANKLATEIVSIPRNVNLTGDTTDLTDDFEENVSDWICEHGLCGELKKDPKLIEGLARKLNKLKSQGIDDESVVEKMKEEIHQFVDDVGIAIETIDELIDELMKQLSNTVQTNEMEKIDQDELTEVFTGWLSNLPGASDLHPRKFEKITKELVKIIIEGRDQGNENLGNDISNYLVDADLGIDSADLGIHVEELMEKLNLLPSNKYHKEQIKKEMIKDILDIIENLSVSQDKKKELRNKAHQIVENHLLRSSLNSKEAHDDMKDAIIEDLDDAISGIDLPKESRLRLKASLGNILNSNFEKSYMRLRRLSREGSDLKQTIAKDVRNAVKELPIDTDKKKNLMQQVKGTLSKNMHKPLPSNVKNTINDEISNIIEKCPISEDNSILGSLKKILSVVASKHLNICVPKCVCDIQDQIEKDVGIVIDRSSIDTGKKKELMKSIQDILTENEDRQLSDEVLRTIKDNISGVVSDLSIPQDKKDVLKKTVADTISKDFNKALSNLRHDLNKIRNKLFDDICNIIEKSPIPRHDKTHLKNKLKSMLARNLDSSLSDEEKYTILNDVSNIVKDDMSEEKRRSLTNKLAKKLDTQQRKEVTNEIHQLTKNLKEFENKILEYILREMKQAVEEAPIPREKKNELKMKLKDMGTVDYKKRAVDIAEALTDGINEILDELNLPIGKKNELKSELAAAIDEYSKLLKDVGPEYIQLKRRSSTANGKHKKIENGLMHIEEFDEKAKESILQGFEDIIEESAIPEEKKMELKRKFKKMVADHLKKPLLDDVLEAIKSSIAVILDELKILKPEKDKLKRALINMTEENVAIMQDVDKTKAKESILQGFENIITGSAVPEERKMELKKNMKRMATDNLKKPFSDDVQDAIKIGIADILDELQIPKPEKNKLKHELINITNDYSDNLREAKRHIEELDEAKVKENILQSIEDIIEESAIPEMKKKELKRKLKKMATDNLKKPLSDDVIDAIKIGIPDILDELQASTPEKNKLKRAVMNMADNYLDNLRAAKLSVKEVDQTKAKESILQGIEKIIAESAVHEEKKMELKRKLKKMATDNLEKPFSDDVQDAIKIGIADILDELQIPKHEKDKLKRALMNMTDENVTNLRDIDKAKAKESILRGIEKIIAESAIPEEKKMELKRKLKKMATDNFDKPLSDDVQDTIKMGIADILDDLKAPTPQKNKLKRALINMTNDYLDNLRDAKRPMDAVDERKAKERILQDIEDIIEESAIPEEKKIGLERKLKKMATDNLKKPFSDDVQDAIKIGITDILEELQILKHDKDKLKRALLNITRENLANLQDVDKTRPKESILQGIEKIIKESPSPEEKKTELKQKLKKMATDNLKKPFSDDVQDAVKIGIADILDDLQIPKHEKDKLNRALMNMTNENMANLRDVDKAKAKESTFQGIEKIIAESGIPEEKKMDLKRKLKKMATDNLEKRFSDDVQDAIKMGIADILDDLKAPTSEKNKLKRALIDMTNDYLDNLRDAKRPIEAVDEKKAKETILQDIEDIIGESAIPEEKKIGLERKLKKMATDNLKKPFSDDVKDAIKIGMADILDELQIPKSEKNKLKRALLNMVKENVDNLRNTKPVGALKDQRPEIAIDETKARERILQGIEMIIEDSVIPEEKKMGLKRKLNKMIADNLKKPFSDDVEDAIKIGMADILDELQIPKSEKNLLKRALMNIAGENLAELRGITAKLPKRKKNTETQKNMLLGLEKAVDEAPIPVEEKNELKEKLKDLAAKILQISSDDFEESLKDSIHEIIRELNSPKDTKSPYGKTKSDASDSKKKGIRSPVSQKPLKGLMPIEEVDETNEKESILQGIDKIIDDSAIPEEKKMELKRKLNKMTADNLKKPFSDDVQDAMKFGIADILDELQASTPEKNKLKHALLNMVDENEDNIRDVPLKLSSQAFKELENYTQNNILLGFEKAIDEAPIPIDTQKELKKKLKDVATKNFQKSLSDDTAEALKDGIDEILDELNLPKDKKNKLKSELTPAIDENLSNLKNEINLAKSMPVAKKNKLNIIIRRVLPQFDEAVDPSYQKQLAEEFDELLEIALTDGDFNNARRKLIKKLMREQNLSEKKASAPVDELIGRAREMALKEERYELDPSYVKTLEADINDLVGIALVDGDFEDARRKLTTKLMREQNLPEEEASACADDLIDKAKKLTLAAQAKDKSLLHKKALTKTISDAVDKSTMSKQDKSDLKNKLLSKLKQYMDKKPYINKDDLEPLKSEVLKDLKEIIDKSSIPTAKKNELKSLLNEDLSKTVDEIMDHYDDEEGYTKDYTKALSKVVNKSPMRNLEKSYLKKELAKTFEGIMDDLDDDKIKKHKETFTKAINDAVDQSTLSKPDKKSLKKKLLNKMEETVDDSHNINDTGTLKAEFLKDCKNIVDASSIPTGQKNELKILLKEEIMDDYDDEEMEESPEYDDKLSEYKEAFANAMNEAVSKSPGMDYYDEKELEDKLKKYKETFAKAINHAVDQSTLSKPDKNNKKNKLLSKLNQTIDNLPNLNNKGALTAEVLKDSKNVVDISSVPADQKKELKSLLQQAMEDASKELMDDEEFSGEAFAMFKDKIAETVKSWMDKLPIDLDPGVATPVANDIASDILDRHKYLHVHPEAVSRDKDEIENLKYQIFRRMKHLVDPKDILPIMNGTEELYRKLMDLEPSPGFPKFGLRGLVPTSIS